MARTRMRFSGRSRAAFAIWVRSPAATTAPLLPSMTLALLWALQIRQPARTRFPGLLLMVLAILELYPAQMPVRRLPSTIRARSLAAPANMRLCGPPAQFRTWERWEAPPAKRTASTIWVRLSASLTPVPARMLFYGKTAPCRTWAFYPETAAVTLTISMTTEWSWALPRAAEESALLSGQALPECSP